MLLGWSARFLPWARSPLSTARRGPTHGRADPPWQFLLMQEMMKTAPPPLAKVEDVPLLDVAEADVVAHASSGSELTNASAFNLRLVYMETAFHYLSLSLWHGVILSQWMYLLSSDTRIVGIAEGLPGIAKLVAAVAAAVVVDACPRNPLLLWSGVGGIAVHALMAGLVVAGDTVPLQVWYGALSLHAVYAVMQQVLTDAVFADSVATGARAGPYTRRQLLRQCAGLASPLLQLGYFALVPNANHWTEATLRPAMLAGIGAGALSCLLVASLDQSRTLGLASEAAHVGPAPPPLAVVAGAVSDTVAQPLGAAPSAATAAAAVAEEERRRFYNAMRQAGASEPVLNLVEASGAAQSGPPTVETAASAARVRWLILLYDLLRVCSGGLVLKVRVGVRARVRVRVRARASPSPS